MIILRQQQQQQPSSIVVEILQQPVTEVESRRRTVTVGVTTKGWVTSAVIIVIIIMTIIIIMMMSDDDVGSRLWYHHQQHRGSSHLSSISRSRSSTVVWSFTTTTTVWLPPPRLLQQQVLRHGRRSSSPSFSIRRLDRSLFSVENPTTTTTSNNDTFDVVSLTSTSATSTTTAAAAAAVVVSSSSSTTAVPFLTPYQLLYPDSFPFRMVVPSSFTSNHKNHHNNTTTTDHPHYYSNGYDRTLTLHNTIRLFQECLQKIIQASTDNEEEAEQDSMVTTTLHRASSMSHDYQNHTPEETILRIEHQLSTPHRIDPLAWLRRQQQQTSTTTTLPLFYLRSSSSHSPHSPSISSSSSSTSSLEETTEVATMGAVRIMYDTHELLQRYYNYNNSSDSDTNTIHVPTHCQWYGGARFDPLGNHTTGTTTMTSGVEDDNVNEWSDFDHVDHSSTGRTTLSSSSSSGTAYWMLPAIELLVTQRVNPNDSPTNNNHPSTLTVATLAIHLVATKETNYDWKVAAQEVLSMLNQINAECANQIPPTTLPPILERGNSKKARPNKNSRHRHHHEDDNNNNVEYRKDDQELYEEAVAQALKELQPPTQPQNTPRIDDVFHNETLMGWQNAETSINNTGMASNMESSNPSRTELPHNSLEKVVLARKQCLHFGTTLTALDVIRRWKYGGHEGGHLFYLRPGRTISSGSSSSYNDYKHSEFFGCTPERLFSVKGSSGWVKSEALAGTRPRGSTQHEDDVLLHELLESPKDRRENRLTGLYIEQAFDELHQAGLITKWNENATKNDDMSTTMTMDDQSNGVIDTATSGYFVRRLLHLQHLCQRYSAKIYDTDQAMMITRALLQRLHPTPAVCGVPMNRALDFIRRYESIAFDRGYYTGPIGYIGQRETDILVALRCGLATTTNDGSTTVATYAGAGLVHGSTLQGEWAETNYKFAVVSSLFPQSPTTLRGSPTANVAWSTAFVSELIRNGITRFYVCPGSRSTPLVAAIAKAVRSNVGVVHAISVHDERAAGFRAVGYVRGTGNLCAVLTSSGTAVANLYPAIIEAGMDGLPLLVLTADRPYESRAIGANQAIDQVKTFSDSYIRWYRDILPPSDEIPVSIALSDACHAIHLAKELRGPVHINIQFRENLAPDAGPIRGDSRINSLTRFNGVRFTDVPGFERWSSMGDVWSKSYARSIKLGSPDAVQDVANLIAESKRGIIVVGNIRLSVDGNNDQSIIEDAISDFAKAIGFPIFAGVQNANLRFKSSAVVLFAEHLLKCPIVADNLQPDFILQIGTPLLSTAIPDVLVKASKRTKSLPYVLLHPHSPQERSDPSMIVTHAIQAEVLPFINGVMDQLSSKGCIRKCSSQLATLVPLGRMLQVEMKRIIFEASSLQHEPKNLFTEPQIIVALSELFSQGKVDRSLFLSNSMPIRDAEMFFYPLNNCLYDTPPSGFISVGSNRGASGIDGIISSALGYSESTAAPTTLLIGDMATLHDIGSFHSVANSALQQNHHAIKKRNTLTTIIINNDGGGIFSFLPIAKYGNEVGFDEFFAAPTSSFSFSKGAEAFGLPLHVVNNYETFYETFGASVDPKYDTVIEALVVSRNENVKVHQRITTTVETYLSTVLTGTTTNVIPNHLPVKTYGKGKQGAANILGKKAKSMVLLHGWMGDKLEWHESAQVIEEKLGNDWTIYSIDLPGHGASPLLYSSQLQAIQSSLRIRKTNTSELSLDELNIDFMAESVLSTLENDHFVHKIDALVGYSLGGRIALAMKRLGGKKGNEEQCSIMSDSAIILLGAHPGNVVNCDSSLPNTNAHRIRNDESTAADIVTLADKSYLQSSDAEAKLLMNGFLKRWYCNPIWTGLTQRDGVYHEMIQKRSKHLLYRGRDIAHVLSSCSPPRSEQEDWKYSSPDKTLFVAGERDDKYKNIGLKMQSMRLAQYQEVTQSSHALLVEAPVQIADIITTFLLQNYTVEPKKILTAKNLSSDVPVLAGALFGPANLVIPTPLWSTSVDGITTIGALKFERFVINILDKESRSPVLGAGWGKDSVADTFNSMTKRQGFIIQISCSNGLMNGLGEISPLKGLHYETLDDVQFQIATLQKALEEAAVENLPYFEADRILSLDGSLNVAIERLAVLAKVDRLLPSVRSGLEMGLISLAAQQVSFPIHQALAIHATRDVNRALSNRLLLSGLLPRTLSTQYTPAKSVHLQRSFKSIKVKVGHQDIEQDKTSILQGFQKIERHLSGRNDGRIRADANRAWNESQAIAFATLLEGLDVHAIEKIEYIEEPLQKVLISNSSMSEWTLATQVTALERSFLQTNLRYAIDESLADVVMIHQGTFDDIKNALEAVFKDGSRGCAAMILKPSLLGYELSFQIAQFIKTELGIAAVFSSSFDSGLGLAHTAFLSNIVDRMGVSETYPHGLGTFTLLESDTITPAFESYVNNEGILNVPLLSRALFGLSLDEISDSSTFPRQNSPPSIQQMATSNPRVDDEISYEASTATSSSGKEISVAVSLPLSFSAETAWLRFTDLPSMSRWSPWITSVRYEGLEETEWIINVRGIPLKWRATSQLLYEPFNGIQWQSVSGLQNRGVVEFIPDGNNVALESSCVMNVRMTITPPRLFRPFLPQGSLFLEDFLRDRLLKWSLEMFRDVVKADLARERYELLSIICHAGEHVVKLSCLTLFC